MSEWTRDMSEKKEIILVTGSNGYLGYPLAKRFAETFTAVGVGSVSHFANMLVRSGVKLFKYYLDISKAEQKRRRRDRTTDPLKQWKVRPIDAQAIKHWKAYSLARYESLGRSHNPMAPWTLVRANDKRLARLNIIKDLLGRLHYADKDERLIRPDPDIVFAYDVANLENGQRAK